MFELTFRALYIPCVMEHTCICKCVCACGQLVEDCVTMVILNKAYREKLGSWSVSPLAPIGDSHTLTLLKDIYSSSIHMSSSLVFVPPFRAAFTHFLSTANSHLQSYTNTSNKAQDVNVLLFLISATTIELITIINLTGQMLMQC